MLLSLASTNAVSLSETNRRPGKRKAAQIVEEDDPRVQSEKRAKQNGQSLLEAARKGDLQKCIQAIRDGADVSFQSCGLSPLFYAAFYGHDMILDYLVNCGAAVNEKNLTGVTPLAKAIESGRPDALHTVQCLFKHKADPNIADSNGNTPLMKAIKAGSSVDLIKCLVGNPTTDVNQHNCEKNTALHEAAFKGNKEVVDVLIGARADVHRRNNAGKIPLHRAITGNHVRVARVLLDQGADINAQDSMGYTPGHYAAFFGLLDSTKFLAENGANLDLRERISNKTCLELAQERRHYDVAEYIGRTSRETIPLLSLSFA